ncbi:thymidylate kinase [Basidiobolus meristosporus CBS 931.73]|uniref:Thymidylate kinase n=1 Tax=Basidiobolus meristosporus CBS 931.73 TaxID=1314790 RepID=A0A1Y1XTZ2_9FUNG|nr:thymidylate kinase [Basidiobolus meristosporus CBS 931.73]|eukprot:ORX89231.1 thymidylate kinase [Basidiobolus meristosporus CBS 931.73]
MATFGRSAAKRGAFILFEGCDRCGKTTQSSKLVEHLRATGVATELMKFPNRETTIGKMIDQYLRSGQDLDDQTIHLLFSANRWEAMNEMREKLLSGITVVVDRYAFSGVAFSAAKGLDIKWCQNPDVGLIQPDVVFLLDMPIENTSERDGFGEERYEKRSMQIKVRELFLSMQNPTWRVLDARRSIEDLQQEIVKISTETLAKCQKTAIKDGLWK